MGMSVRRTAYGPESALALRDAVAEAKAGEPLAPVTVVVPSNHVGVATRRLLSSGTLGPVTGAGVGLAAVAFLTPYRLAELLGAATLAGQGRRPVSTPVLAAAVRAELAERTRPVRAGRRAPRHRVGAGRHLPRAARPLAWRARRASRRLERPRPRGGAPPPGRPGPARAALVRRGGPARRGRRPRRARRRPPRSGAIVVHLPQRLSQHSARLLQRAGRARAHHRRRRVHRRARRPTPRSSTSLRRLGLASDGADAVGDPTPVATDRTTIVTASDADEEVRAAVRAVVDAVRAGTRLDRIAVLHASPRALRPPRPRAAPRRRHRHQRRRRRAPRRAGGRPHAARAARPPRRRLPPAGRVRLAVVGAGPPRRPACAHHRVGAPVARGRGGRRPQRLGPPPHPARAAQRGARAPRPSSTTTSPSGVPGRLREPRPSGPASCSAFVLGLIDDLARRGRAPAPLERARRVGPALARAAARRARSAASAGTTPPSGRRPSGSSEPSTGSARSTPSRARCRSTCSTAPSSSSSSDDLGRVGRFGDGVLVGSVEMGIGLDLDLVVVLGPGRGLVPGHRPRRLAPARPRARARPAASCALRDRPGGAPAPPAPRRPRRRAPPAALRAPRRPAPQRRARAVALGARPLHAPGRCADHGGGRPISSTPTCRGCATWLSFDAGLRHLDVPGHRAGAPAPRPARRRWLDLARHRRRAPPAGAEVIDGPAQRPLHPLRRQPRRPAGARRRSTASPRPPASSAGPTAPTATWSRTCSAPRPIENPEDNLTITPLDKGSLVHEALERFLSTCSTAAAPSGPSRASRGPPTTTALLQEIGGALCDQYEAKGLVGRPIFWTRDRRRILADLDATLRRRLRAPAAHAARRRWPPSSASASIVDSLAAGGGARCPTAARCACADASTASTSAADGTIHVVDYKTGRYHASYRDLLRRRPRAAAAPSSSSRLRPGRPARREGPDRRRCTPSTGSSPARAGSTACGYASPTRCSSAPRGARQDRRRHRGRRVPTPPAGRCPPTSGIDCQACDPDGLGTAELRKQWDRKRHDPALRALRRAGRAPRRGGAGMTAAPPDQAARDRIATDLDTTLFVEAGAGSGKTTALVGRVVALVTSGAVELRNLAAITFTEKAGAELRDRVRRELQERGRWRRPRRPRRRSAAGWRWPSSTAPPSARCTRSPSASCPSTRWRRSCLPRWRCSTR